VVRPLPASFRLEEGPWLWNIAAMRFLAAILVALLTLPALGSAKMTAVTIDGVSCADIQDVHIVSGGRIVILYGSGGTTVTADKLPQGFLDSWGITLRDLAASKAAAEKQAEQSLAQAARAGEFREVDGVVYDLRKPQAGWRQFSDAKILQVTEAGALVQDSPNGPAPSEVFVRNLPRIFADNEKAAFMAKFTGDFSYINKYLFEKTIRAYDVGRVCQRNEIPDAIVKGGQAAASLPSGVRHAQKERPARMLPDRKGLRVIGSGFFVTKDGYFLTNFHVVRDANKVEVKYKLRVLKAEVAEVDEDNDLALLKVSGKDFPPLAISRKASVDLGEEVFTIGFPNIDMQGMEPKFTDGKISSLSGMRDDPAEYQISVPVQPGNSGGPLCDANGEVVGIIVARLDDLAALHESGAMPQNVNYAIKSKLALRFLRRVEGVARQLMPSATTAPPATPAKPVRAVQDGIAMVMVY
jgi:S1-C subfamily serine protease